MGQVLEGAGLEVDGVKFELFAPTITLEAIAMAAKEGAYCDGCRQLFTPEGNGLYWKRGGIMRLLCQGCFNDITGGN